MKRQLHFFHCRINNAYASSHCPTVITVKLGWVFITEKFAGFDAPMWKISIKKLFHQNRLIMWTKRIHNSHSGKYNLCQSWLILASPNRLLFYLFISKPGPTMIGLLPSKGMLMLWWNYETSPSFLCPILEKNCHWLKMLVHVESLPNQIHFVQSHKNVSLHRF